MNKTNRIVKAISASGGRFFGLTTQQGETLNAQFVRETPNYVVVRDRNAKEIRKFARRALKRSQWVRLRSKSKGGRNTAFFLYNNLWKKVHN